MPTAGRAHRQRRSVAAAADARRCWRRAGFAARTCASAEEALALLAESPAGRSDRHRSAHAGHRRLAVLPAAALAGVSALQRHPDPGRVGDLLRQRCRAAQPRARRQRIPARRRSRPRRCRTTRARCSAAGGPSRRRRCVIAHADPLEADRLRGAFVAAGYEVDCAATAAEALATWRALQPELSSSTTSLPDRPAAERAGGDRGPGSPTVAVAIVDAAAAGEAACSWPGTGPTPPSVAPADPARLIELRRHRAPPALADAHRGAARRAQPRAARLGGALALVGRGDSRDRRRPRRRRHHPSHQPHRRRAPRLAGTTSSSAATCASSSAARAATATTQHGAFEAIWMIAATGAKFRSRSSAAACAFDGREGFLSVARDISARQELGPPAPGVPRHADPRHQEPARRRPRLRRAARRGRPAERGAAGPRRAHPGQRRHRPHPGRQLPQPHARSRPGSSPSSASRSISRR